jgi:DNA-binding GntR family transcriptional regulator
MSNYKSAAPQCRYALLTAALQRDIEQGRYAIGATLPTEAELRQQFNVSRHTVRAALRQLRDLGLVSSRQGSGTVVQANSITPRYVQSLDSLDDFFEFLRQARPEILSRDLSALPAHLAKTYGLTARQQWLHMQTLRFWHDSELPALLTDAYIDAKYSGIKDSYDGSMPCTSLLEQMYGVALAFMEQDIQAVTLDKSQSQLLKARYHAPALQTNRRCYASNGELLLISCSISPAERYTYSTRMRITSN